MSLCWSERTVRVRTITTTMTRYRGALNTLEIVMTSRAGCERIPYMDMEEQCRFQF